MDSNEKSPLVSIIVPARNEENNIQKCVNSLLSLDYEAKEIIIVNDGSTDWTGEFLRKYGDKIKVITTDGVGPSRARNIAIDEAKGENVAFTDADCVVDRNWIRELLKGFISEDVYGVGGAQLKPRDDSSFAGLVGDFFQIFGFVSDYIHLEEKITEVEHNPTCNVMYRKDVFRFVGKFREDMWPCEDLEFDVRLRKSELVLMNNPKAFVYHYRPGRLGSFMKMMYRYGKAHAKLNLIHGFTQPIHYIPLAIFAFLIFNVMLYKSIPNYLILVNILFLLIVMGFVFFKTKGMRAGISIIGLFVSSIFVWLFGYFIGSQLDFWGKA